MEKVAASLEWAGKDQQDKLGQVFVEGAAGRQVVQMGPDQQDWQGQADVEQVDLELADLVVVGLVPVDWEQPAEEVHWDQQGCYCHCYHYCH